MKKIIAFVLALIMIMGLGVTAFAETEWAVKIIPNNGSGEYQIKVNDGATIPKPETDPTKENMIFYAWFYDGSPWDFSTPVHKNMYIKARFRYTVTFNMDGGTPSVDQQLILKEGLVSKPNDPSKTGYTFGGWYKEATCENAWNFDTDKVTGNITLYAKWAINKYTVSFNAQGHGTAPEAITNVEHGSTITAPTALTETGYTFGGWFKESGCTTEWNFATDTVTGNTTIYAKWTINKYTVTFDANGHGVAPETQNVDYNTTVTIPDDPSEEGWHFDDWYQEVGCSNKFDFSTLITTDTTLFAKWLEMYTVTFDSKGGSDVPSKKVEKGSTVAEPSVPTKEHYEFVKWCSDSECTTEWKFDSNAITEDTTIYAKWEINKYTVSFDMNGLTDVTDVPTGITAVEHGNTVTRPETNPSKTGYVFRGWYQEAACTNVFDFSTPITANTTVYAKWLRLIDKPTASKTTFTYTGEKQTLALDNPDDSVDYIVTGNTGTDVGNYTAKYTLVDNTAWNETGYPTDDVTIDWKIVKANISPEFTEDVICTYGDDVTAAAKAKVADEKSVVIASNDIVIKYKAENDTEFTADVPTDAGTYTLAVNVKSGDNYDGYTADDKTCTLTVNKKEVSVVWAKNAFVYNGEDQTAAIEAKFEDISKNNISLDIAVTGGKFKNAGTYTVTASLKEDYAKNYVISSGNTNYYTIMAKNISGATVELGDALIYNGKNQTQTVKKVTIDGLEATYTVSGNVQKEVGTYTLTVTGTGNFSGTATKQFVIIPDKNYHYKENKYGDIEIGDGEISFKDYNEKHMPEISIAGNKGDLVEMLVKMGKITSDDLVRIANGETLNIMLETQKTYVSDRVWDKIEKRAGNKEIDSYFDIEFYLYWNDDTENRTDITDTSGYGYITVEVEAPDVKHAKSRNYSVIRYHNDGYKGHAVELSAKYDSKRETLTFRTNQFSVYAIAYSDVRDDDDDGKIVINGKSDKKKDDKKKDINPNTGALVF